MKLLSRVSFLGKGKLSFLFLLIPIYLVLLFFCYKSDNPMNELFVSFLVIGGFNYHGLEDISSLRTNHLYPFFMSKVKASLYGVFGEVALKLLLISPFVPIALPQEPSFVLCFIVSVIAFTSILYLLCDLSGVNKMYLNMFRVITLVPIALLDFSSLFDSKENIIEAYFVQNHVALMYSTTIVLIIILAFVFATHYKVFFGKIIN